MAANRSLLGSMGRVCVDLSRLGDIASVVGLCRSCVNWITNGEKLGPPTRHVSKETPRCGRGGKVDIAGSSWNSKPLGELLKHL